MNLVLLSLSQVAFAFDCATPAALDALRGTHAPLFAEMLVSPPNLHRPPGPPPPSRVIYGTPYARHLETDHFSINAVDASVSDAAMTASAEALERAWSAYIDVLGWPAPVSSDSYFLWVLLDPSLGGTTGFTTEYFTDEFPDGYPVVYVNPTTLTDFGSAFYTSLNAHEFMHAVQFGMRDYDLAGGDTENWYWEASATHASELAAPEVDGHQYASDWYAQIPEVRYDSYENAHQYGMFVFNAYLEEGIGAGTMRAVWEQGADAPGVAWPDLMEEAVGVPASALWAAFTDAYGNRTLVESRLYSVAKNEGALTDGAGGVLDELGTHYWTISEDMDVLPDGDVILGGTSEPGTPRTVLAGEVLSVTALSDSTTYQLSVGAPGEWTTEDSGGGDEGGAGGDGAGGTTDGTTDSATGSDGSKSGGCATLTLTGGFWAMLLGGLGLFGRRRR